jgi:23S rRNA (cytidine1920-2'-O)/16S rRNA (cytidine1409-2'-O)-methyltransferase
VASISPSFVSRGGLKLRHALDTFPLSVAGAVCADFGCSTGGFTDCLLQAGAARVYAIDTAYGELAWKLRNDPRVVVMERTNCLHAVPPQEVAQAGGVDLVVGDASWTPQRLLIPAMLRWCKPPTQARPGGRLISLLKPHYEVKTQECKDAGLSLPPGRGGVLRDQDAERVVQIVLGTLPALGVRVVASTKSPILGGAGKKSKAAGNPEWLILAEPV